MHEQETLALFLCFKTSSLTKKVIRSILKLNTGEPTPDKSRHFQKNKYADSFCFKDYGISSKNEDVSFAKRFKNTSNIICYSLPC
jgi:hypothetical protein